MAGRQGVLPPSSNITHNVPSVMTSCRIDVIMLGTSHINALVLGENSYGFEAIFTRHFAQKPCAIPGMMTLLPHDIMTSSMLHAVILPQHLHSQSALPPLHWLEDRTCQLYRTASSGLGNPRTFGRLNSHKMCTYVHLEKLCLI